MVFGEGCDKVLPCPKIYTNPFTTFELEQSLRLLLLINVPCRSHPFDDLLQRECSSLINSVGTEERTK